MFRTSARKERVVKVTTSRKEYSIHLAGTVDMDNTTTRRYETFEIAFQPNVSLTIENTGKTLVENPRVITNGRRKWWSMEELLKEILAGARTDQEKALRIWDFANRNRHHDDPIFVDDELHDPVKMFNVFGAGLCDDSGYIGCSLLYHAGLNEEQGGRNPIERCLHGHMMCEAFVDGDYQFLDIDEHAFYLDRENERPVSGDTLARDHDLAKREHAYGPIFKGWNIGQSAASLFGADDGETFRAAAGHRIDMTLRPGEKVVYRWDNVGKFTSHNTKRNRRFWGNSLHVYTPRLAADEYRLGVADETGIAACRSEAGAAVLAGKAKSASLVYEMNSPYAACGGRVRAGFAGRSAKDRFGLSISLDGKKWRKIWRGSGAGTVKCDLELDKHLQVRKGSPKYCYFVKVHLGSSSAKAAQLATLTIETDLMASPHSLPRLSLGKNHVVYTDDSRGAHEVTITHRWEESRNVTPPKPPARPVFPKVNAVVQASRFQFQWPAAADSARYHIQVSREPDMRLPYRPCLDVVIESTSHGSPFTGMFSPNRDYCWRVRPQSKEGVWGKWSRTWRFRWEGPRVPVNVERRIQSGKMWISWEPNPRGARPVYYEVYGSDEKGFSVSKEPYHVKGIGEQPSNFLAQTTETEMLVVDPEDGRLSMNRSFYRVVAIDKNGTESGCSDYAEMPHPYVYSKPIRTATVGAPYRYELKILRSIGDLQYRYGAAKNRFGFFEREEYEFELARGPKWLELDREEGHLSGTPTAKSVGEATVEVVVKRLYPHEVEPTAQGGEFFQKTDPQFQATARQRFRLNVRGR